MGSGASTQEASHLDDVLTQAEVKRIAGEQYQESVFLEVASDELTVTRRQLLQCAELANRNLLRYVVVGTRGQEESRRPRLSPEEMARKVMEFRDAGNLVEAAVAAQRMFMAHPSAERCLQWLQALHANGASPGRLVNLAEGYCCIYPGSRDLSEFLLNSRKKVTQPFEETEDQLYVLTEKERQRVDDAVDALNLEVNGRDAEDLSYFEYCEVAKRAGVRIVDDVIAYLKNLVLCTYVGKMTLQTIFWTRRDSNMPGLEREDVILQRYAKPLTQLLRRKYPRGMAWFEKDYDNIQLDLEEFRIELMNTKMVFALWDTIRSAIRAHDQDLGQPLPDASKDDAVEIARGVPRPALVQLYCFFEVVGQHLFSKMSDWKEHERFRMDWKDKRSLSRFMRAKYQAIAEDKNRLSRPAGEHVVPTAGGDAFAPVLLAQRAEAAEPIATAAKASPAATARSTDPRQATAPTSQR